MIQRLLYHPYLLLAIGMLHLMTSMFILMGVFIFFALVPPVFRTLAIGKPDLLKYQKIQLENPRGSNKTKIRRPKIYFATGFFVSDNKAAKCRIGNIRSPYDKTVSFSSQLRGNNQLPVWRIHDEPETTFRYAPKSLYRCLQISATPTLWSLACVLPFLFTHFFGKSHLKKGLAFHEEQKALSET